jgi:hypothetical protein
MRSSTSVSFKKSALIRWAYSFRTSDTRFFHREVRPVTPGAAASAALQALQALGVANISDVRQKATYRLLRVHMDQINCSGD